MKFPCMLRQLTDGRWLVRYTGAALKPVEVTATSRAAALAKMRNELRYRVELCPCSGVSDAYVQLEVREEAGEVPEECHGR
jgi:hypothetical protein